MSHAARAALVLAVGLVAACATAPPAGPAPAAPASQVHVRATLPAGMDRPTGLVALPYTPAEVEAGLPEDPSAFLDTLRRARISRVVRVVDGVLELTVSGPPPPFAVDLYVDTADQGLEVLFGARPGVARGRAVVPATGEPPVVALEGAPFAEPPERCAGEGLELLRLDAPETRRQDDDGQRLLCVQLPPSYATSPLRRYPVVLAFPGFSGWHAGGDGWRARGILAREWAARGVEALVVGVGTRTAEGTSYVGSSPRMGDWERYLTERVIPELDRRYRTLPVRAALGHSTGGWNALVLATRHPDLVQLAASSSPDALDLDAWLLGADGAVRPEWQWWLRAEHALGGPGQFASYAAAWSPDESAPRGFAWSVDPETGALRLSVYKRWLARSPLFDLRGRDGLRRARQLSGNIAITAGRGDEFGLFAPTERYVQELAAAGIEVLWLPSDLGHFGEDERRWTPIGRFLAERLASTVPRPE